MRLIRGRRGKSALLNTLIKGENLSNRTVVSCYPYVLHFPDPYYVIAEWASLEDLSNAIIKLIKDSGSDIVYIYGDFNNDDLEWLRDIEDVVSMLTVTISDDDGTDNIIIEYV